jgi:S-methyl-5-thioribose kinase
MPGREPHHRQTGAALRALRRRVLAADAGPRPSGGANLVEHYQHSPQHTVKIHHFDPELAVMVMEDLSSHRIWRGELIKNNHYPQAARQLGEYLAHTLFHTSDFYLHPHEKKAQVAKFINPEMCEITEDLFFNDPYQIHERNNYPAELENDVAALRDDAQLKIAVASLKHRFSHTLKRCCTGIFTAAPFCGGRQPEGHRRRVRLRWPDWL